MVLTLEQAMQATTELLFSVRGKGLNEAERVVFRAAWENATYEEAAANSGYTAGYLNSEVGHELFQTLARALGEKKIFKKRLRSILEQRGNELNLPAQGRVPPPSTNIVLGGQPPSVEQFVGYTEELATLRQLVFEKQCVALTGQVGIGKSSLATKLLLELSADPNSEFDYLIWKSLQYKPHFSELADDLLRILLNQLNQEVVILEQATAKLSLLIELVQSHRCLLVLDGAEAILQGQRLWSQNPYGEYQEYGIFIGRMVEERHQSCLLLTSREPFTDITRYQNFHRPAGVLKLTGLGTEASQILAAKGLTGKEVWADLISLYGGNPFGLKMAANCIKDFFAGDARRFVEERSVLLFEDTLEQQLTRLTKLEQELLIYLARQLEDQGLEVLAFPQILAAFRLMTLKVSLTDLIQSLHLLSDRSLVESGIDSDGERCYSLQPVVKKFVLTRLVPGDEQFPKAI